VPLVFSKRLLEQGPALRAAAGVGIFCALSGAVYLLNDVVDIEKDRAHPKKRFRPIPSGQLSVGLALTIAALLSLGGLGAALALSPWFALAALGYIVNNLAYSFVLKNVAFLDVLSIALGFFLRVLGGSYAVPVPASEWLLAETSLLAAFLAFGKRTHELASTPADAVARQRKVLTRYKLEHLRLALYSFGGLTSLGYVMYTQSAHTVAFFHTRLMILSAPFGLLAIARFVWLVSKSQTAESPTDAMLHDRLFLGILAALALVILGVIYHGRLS
jgi:4-hydroxybenzoate polyprenyltransferase